MYKEKFSLKDQLFNAEKIKKIASEIAIVHPDFDQDGFLKANLSAFPGLELKERILCIAQALINFLPPNFEVATQILVDSLPEPCNPELQDDDFGDFIYAPYGEFAALRGCNEENLETSLHALEAFTTRFSMEYAIRDFINRFPDQTFQRLKIWSVHPHYHVRRLASEGSRPKLPWGKNISTPIQNAIGLLENLHADKTRFVTRSVANHLNDLSKIEPDLVFDLLEKWHQSKKQSSSELTFITKHALRTLIKQGNKRAMNLLGYEDSPKVSIEVVNFPSTVKMNDFLHFEFRITAYQDAALLIDYVIHFQNSKSKMSSVKVFKLSQLKMKKEQSLVLGKKHEMKQFMSTRTLYTGAHHFQLQINGQQLIGLDFMLID